MLYFLGNIFFDAQWLGSSFITKWKSPFYIMLEKSSAQARNISFVGKTTQLEQGCREKDVKSSGIICDGTQMEVMEDNK